MEKEETFNEYQKLRGAFQEDVRELLSESSGIDKLYEIKETRQRIMEKVEGISWMLGVIAQEKIEEKDEEVEHKIVVDDVEDDKKYHRISFDIHFGDDIGTHTWHKGRKIDHNTFKNKDEFYTPFLNNRFPEALAKDCVVSESYMKEIAEEVRKIEDILGSIERDSLNSLSVPVGEDGMFRIYLSREEVFKYSKKDDETKELIDYLRETNTFKFHNKYSSSDRVELSKTYNIQIKNPYDKRAVERILNHSEEIKIGLTNAEEELKKAEEKLDIVIENIQEMCELEDVIAFSI